MENEHPQAAPRPEAAESFTDEPAPFEAAVFAAVFVGVVVGAAGIILVSVPVVLLGLALALLGLGIFICCGK